MGIGLQKLTYFGVNLILNFPTVHFSYWVVWSRLLKATYFYIYCFYIPISLTNFFLHGGSYRWILCLARPHTATLPRGRFFIPGGMVRWASTDTGAPHASQVV